MKLNICLKVSEKIGMNTIGEMLDTINEHKNNLFCDECIDKEMSELYKEIHFTPFLYDTKITDAINWLKNNLDFKTKKHEVGCCYYDC